MDEEFPKGKIWFAIIAGIIVAWLVVWISEPPKDTRWMVTLIPVWYVIQTTVGIFWEKLNDNARELERLNNWRRASPEEGQ